MPENARQILYGTPSTAACGNFEVMTRHHLEPKRIRMVYPHENKDANMVLIEAVKGGKALLKVESPLVVYKEDGTYTQELLKMY